MWVLFIGDKKRYGVILSVELVLRVGAETIYSWRLEDISKILTHVTQDLTLTFSNAQTQETKATAPAFQNTPSGRSNAKASTSGNVM